MKRIVGVQIQLEAVLRKDDRCQAVAAVRHELGLRAARNLNPTSLSSKDDKSLPPRKVIPRGALTDFGRAAVALQHKPGELTRKQRKVDNVSAQSSL